ncbi:MAG: hypothetical protein HYS38_04050, partial [Acidobacteria bacterium]|nr:hypothetical protein [Acidobacteriota bacterium]
MIAKKVSIGLFVLALAASFALAQEGSEEKKEPEAQPPPRERGFPPRRMPFPRG